MRKPPGTRSVLPALVLLLAGCAAGGIPYTGSHLTPTECRDLAALRSNAPATMAQHQSELVALRKAGYNPSPWYDDPYYPDDLQAAQLLALRLEPIVDQALCRLQIIRIVRVVIPW